MSREEENRRKAYRKRKHVPSAYTLCFVLFDRKTLIREHMRMTVLSIKMVVRMFVRNSNYLMGSVHITRDSMRMYVNVTSHNSIVGHQNASEQHNERRNQKERVAALTHYKHRTRCTDKRSHCIAGACFRSSQNVLRANVQKDAYAVR